MKTTFASVLSAMAVANSAMAQVTPGPDDTFVCSKAKANFCAGDSLSTNIIIYCNEEYTGVPGNCNDNLSGIDRENDVARCYESSPTAGDAACEYNGTVYPAGGTPFAVPTATATLANFVAELLKRTADEEECTTGPAVVTVTAVASETAPGYTSILTAAYGTAPSSIVVATSMPYPVATGYGSTATSSNTTMVNPTIGYPTSSAMLTSLLTATGTPTMSEVASSVAASASATIFTGAANAQSVNLVGGLVAGVVGAAALLI